MHKNVSIFVEGGGRKSTKQSSWIKGIFFKSVWFSGKDPVLNFHGHPIATPLMLDLNSMHHFEAFGPTEIGITEATKSCFFFNANVPMEGRLATTFCLLAYKSHLVLIDQLGLIEFKIRP